MTTTPTYSELLQQLEWRVKRNVILNRDGRRCRNCNSTLNLEVHHRQYHIQRETGAYKAPWDYANHYLITLCSNCHESGHQQYAIPTFKY